MIFFEHEGNRAVRDGHWKLVSKYPGPWELYDMSADRTELADLAAKDAERLRRIERAYQQWADRCDVLSREELQARRKASR